MVEMGPRQKAEEFIQLKKNNTVLPPDDVNLSRDLYDQRIHRKFKESLQGNGFLTQMKNLLDSAPISEFFKKQLIYEAGLESVYGWTSWGEFQEKAIREDAGISLKENRYGIFDPKEALAIEARYFMRVFPMLDARKKNHSYNPVSHEEWGVDLFKRLKKAADDEAATGL
jgi:hypothetical protein